jgi:hypothetical protein
MLIFGESYNAHIIALLDHWHGSSLQVSGTQALNDRSIQMAKTIPGADKIL